LEKEQTSERLRAYFRRGLCFAVKKDKAIPVLKQQNNGMDSGDDMDTLE
jgi:hypothetical protein